MLNFIKKRNTTLLLHNRYLFSTTPDTPPPPKTPSKPPTPKMGMKMPRLKDGEEVIAFRPYGNTDISTKSKNYNFRLQEEINEQRKFKLVIGLVILSLVPFFMFLKNAEANFRKAGVKELAKKRRERLDAEHGVNREKMREDFEELDKMFRVTEKEEIKKYMQIGKTAQDYYDQKDGVGETEKEVKEEPAGKEPTVTV